MDLPVDVSISDVTVSQTRNYDLPDITNPNDQWYAELFFFTVR
jgi:hypothetical protein